MASSGQFPLAVGARTPTLDALDRGGRARATVDRAAIDPRGRGAGLLLTDGTWIEATPAESTRLAQLVAPGDTVELSYGPASTLHVADARAGAALDIGPLTPARGGGPNSVEGAAAPRVARDGLGAPFTVRGRVRYVFRTLSGKPAGLVLDDGTQVHAAMPASRALERVQPGQWVTVRGPGVHTRAATALWVYELGTPALPAPPASPSQRPR